MTILYPISVVIVAAFSYLMGKLGERAYRDLELEDANFRNRRLIEQNANLRQMLAFVYRESKPETQNQFRNRIKLEGKRPL